jgi:uncharacterized protein
MKIVIPGGSGDVGAILRRWFLGRGDEVVVFSRSGFVAEGCRVVTWDGRTLGDWVAEFDGADVVINLAGRTVNCRYNAKNLKEMMDSRVESTAIIGEAIGLCVVPPRVWLQSSTATIYAHRFDAANDEIDGILGGGEPSSPAKWEASIAIAKAWEETLWAAETPGVRKVALRSAMTMSPDEGSVFAVLSALARRGLGGQLGNGRQYVSWIHEDDFARAIQFLIDEDVEGAVNVCSPGPVPQKEFARMMREAWGVSIGIPAMKWMIELGCWAMQTESELVLKSRRVVPRRLEEAGFRFRYPEWGEASRDLVRRIRN